VFALVLSGAANYGAIQAGALEVLLEAGFKPSMTVGTSAGALNAIFIASDPTPGGARQLGHIWEAAGKSPIGESGMFTGLRRLIAQQDSLFKNMPLVDFLDANLPPNVETFGELSKMHGVKVYAIAVCMETGELVSFGDQDDDRLIDGAMTSTAIPPYYPPWKVANYRYVDGGVAAKLPIRAAIDRGATQIVAINVEGALNSMQNVRGLIGISGYAVSLMTDHQAKLEIDWARRTGVALRVINIQTPSEVPFWDYSQAKTLYQLGHRVTQLNLDSKPLQIHPEWFIKLRSRLSKIIKTR
jgi:NTE family protein